MSAPFSEWAARGFGAELLPIIPPTANVEGAGKRPAIDNWRDRTITPAEIESWPADNNVGIRSRYFPAIDIDVDDPGTVQAIEEVVVEYLGTAPKRYRQNSARVLLAYALEGEPFGKAAVSFDGGKVEVLADGQQWVADGTHPSGAALKWSEPPVASELPVLSLAHRDELLSRVAEKLEELGKSGVKVTGLAKRATASAPGGPRRIPSEGDRAHARRRASAYVAKMAPAVEHQGGHDQLLNACCRCVELALYEDDVWDIIWNEYNPRCVPPWEDSERWEVERKVREALKLHRLGEKFESQAPVPTDRPASEPAAWAAPDRDRPRQGPRAIWHEWAEEHRVAVRWEGAVAIFTVGGQSRRPDQVLDSLQLDTYGVPGARREILAAAMGEWMVEEAARARQAIIDGIAFDPSLVERGDAQVRRWVKAVSGQEREVDVAVVKHFVWQVKRKAVGLKVEHHMMPVVVGPQGSGKTEAIRRLLGPVYPLTAAPASLKTASDDRAATLYEDALVFFTDEMGLADRTDLDLMKNRITEGFITYRVLGRNLQATAKNNVTWVGASNKSIGELFPDYSGLRRFWQMSTPERCDWDAINAVDATAIWRSVNPHGPTPLTPEARQLVLAEQREEQARDPFDVWADEFEASTPGEVRADEVYKQSFVEWAVSGNWYQGRVLGLGRFRKKMAQRFAKYRRVLHGYPVYALPGPERQRVIFPAMPGAAP